MLSSFELYPRWVPLFKDMLMQCSLKMAGNFLRRDGTGGHIIGFQKLCFESQY